MTVMFHGNFGLNRKYMAGILALGLKSPNLKDKDLAKQFNYAAPFSARYRSWLHKCGVAEQGMPLTLTDIGLVIHKRDPKLQSMVTQWCLHHQLVTDSNRAEAWNFFANEFLQTQSSFTKDDLLDGLTQKLRYHSEMHFGPGSKLNKIIARKILEVYTNEEGLGNLGLLRQDGKKFITLKPKQMGPWNTAASLEKAYMTP